jgi:hypothetical protein
VCWRYLCHIENQQPHGSFSKAPLSWAKPPNFSNLPWVKSNSSTVDAHLPWVKSNSSTVDALPPWVKSNSSTVDALPPWVKSNSSTVDALPLWVKSNSSKVVSHLPRVKSNSSTVDALPPWVKSNSSKVDTHCPWVKSNCSTVDAHLPWVKSNSSTVDALPLWVKINFSRDGSPSPVIRKALILCRVLYSWHYAVAERLHRFNILLSNISKSTSFGLSLCGKLPSIMNQYKLNHCFIAFFSSKLLFQFLLQRRLRMKQHPLK